ncbi:penicillin-binding transpeptidase domain-containing protein [Corynebacterium sp. L4756]|uniref:penicillin-binding transpeptidase domain-containing protein n=1 Tax=unclassified Corynebacterium TaxID=2624378 RepID=UPI00374D2CF7
MKRTVSLLCAVTMAAGAVVACTPKPVSADPTVDSIISAMESGETFGEYFDEPSIADEVFTSTYESLQAESLDVELLGIEQNDSRATANYSVTWDLPRDRELSYETSMVLTKANDEWTGRWQPSMVHPALGANQHLELRSIPAERASVVSSDGVELMRPGLQYRVIADMREVENIPALAREVSMAVERAGGSTPDDLTEQMAEIDGNFSVGVYNEDIGKQLQSRFADHEHVRINEEPALVVRDPGFARDLMSRVSTLVSDQVDGVNGWAVSVVNDEGAAFSNVEEHAPDPSPAVRVSIDYDVQRAAEEAVNLRADSQTMLVAIRPSTGEILAVAQTEEADRDGDVALSGQYPPGSVFKIITAAAGVDQQGLNRDTIVPCPGTMDIYGRVVTNYNGFALGNVPLGEAFAQSCNTTFADMSTKLAPGELADEGKQFGLGLDYDIPGLTTMTGSIPEGETPLERTEAGYGQGYDLASPFGMALVSATVANGSTPIPSLVSTEETKVSEEVEPPSEHVINQLRSMMRQTVTSGTAAGMQASGEIFGKTGEAEINDGSHAWFTGYRADDDIAFATLVVLGGGSETSVSITDSFFQNLDEHRAEPQS